MKSIYIISFIISTVFFISPTCAQAENKLSDLKKCIYCLNTMEVEIGKNRPDLNSDYIHIIIGNIYLDNQILHSLRSDELKHYGEIKDFRYCFDIIDSDVNKASLDVLLKSYHNYYSNNPIDDMAKCYAAFTFKFSEIEKKIRKRKASKIQKMIGEKAGSRLRYINELYNNFNVDYDSFHKTTIKYLRQINSMNNGERANTLKKFMNQCYIYDIPIYEIISIAE